MFDRQPKRKNLNCLRLSDAEIVSRLGVTGPVARERIQELRIELLKLETYSLSQPVLFIKANYEPATRN